MRKYIPMGCIILVALALAGCDPNLSPGTVSNACAALFGPIKYNTYNKNSGRYSGPILAMDLKQRNQIGQYLHCPQYRLKFSGVPADEPGRKW